MWACFCVRVLTSMILIFSMLICMCKWMSQWEPLCEWMWAWSCGWVNVTTLCDWMCQSACVNACLWIWVTLWAYFNAWMLKLFCERWMCECVYIRMSLCKCMCEPAHAPSLWASIFHVMFHCTHCMYGCWACTDTLACFCVVTIWWVSFLSCLCGSTSE